MHMYLDCDSCQNCSTSSLLRKRPSQETLQTLDKQSKNNKILQSDLFPFYFYLFYNFRPNFTIFFFKTSATFCMNKYLGNSILFVHIAQYKTETTFSESWKENKLESVKKNALCSLLLLFSCLRFFYGTCVYPNKPCTYRRQTKLEVLFNLYIVRDQFE